MKKGAGIPAAFHFAIGSAALIFLGYCDRMIAPQISLGVFYLIPVAYVCWYSGEKWGYAMALLSTAAWLEDDILLARSFSTWLPYWNAFVRLGFLAVAAALANMILRLRRLNEAEHQVSELKSNLVSLVSHEFGNLLMTYRLALTLLRESEPGEPSASRLESYAMLGRVYTHLNSAVKNFLNLNRIQSGRFVPNLERTSLLAQIHGVLAVQDSTFANKNISLSTSAPEGNLFVSADPDALTVVLSNLVANAVKYTPEAGSVKVSAEFAPPDSARITIEDTGIGISREELPLIASGYYRTEAGRRAAKGYGVGLKVVHDLLDTLNSHLEIESTPGRGSRFSFCLPLWREISGDPGSTAPQ
ncbi:MAG: sensor histidine kinase [Elusimicrobiota bacterium]